MRHKHADLMAIWILHTELKVEKSKGAKKWYCHSGVKWIESFDYRFAIPNDSEGNRIKFRKIYLHGDLEFYVSEIDQQKAEIWMQNDEKNLEGVVSFWEVDELKPYKKKVKDDKFKNFPGVEFVEVCNNGSLYYEEEIIGNTCINGLCLAMKNPDFIGYGYEWDNQVTIMNEPVVYHNMSDGYINGQYLDGVKPLRPSWVCFRKGE